MRLRVACLLAAAVFGGAAAQGPPQWTAEIPRVWDEAALPEWATPIAGLNVRPTHMAPAAYYALPEENIRTYPVYLPGREPQGYADMLRTVGLQPLIEPESLRTRQDWIRAGERVFRIPIG